jgi:uncharacterized protein
MTNTSELTVVLGVSTDPNRYSYQAVTLLNKLGYEVKAVGIKSGAVGSVKIESELPIETNIHTITLYINPNIQIQYVNRIIEAKPKRVIFNPGTESDNTIRKLTLAGIECVEACTLVMLRTKQY